MLVPKCLRYIDIALTCASYAIRILFGIALCICSFVCLSVLFHFFFSVVAFVANKVIYHVSVSLLSHHVLQYFVRVVRKFE